MYTINSGNIDLRLRNCHILRDNVIKNMHIIGC